MGRFEAQLSLTSLLWRALIVIAGSAAALTLCYLCRKWAVDLQGVLGLLFCAVAGILGVVYVLVLFAWRCFVPPSPEVVIDAAGIRSLATGLIEWEDVVHLRVLVVRSWLLVKVRDPRKYLQRMAPWNHPPRDMDPTELTVSFECLTPGLDAACVFLVIHGRSVDGFR